MNSSFNSENHTFIVLKTIFNQKNSSTSHSILINLIFWQFFFSAFSVNIHFCEGFISVVSELLKIKYCAPQEFAELGPCFINCS